MFALGVGGRLRLPLRGRPMWVGPAQEGPVPPHGQSGKWLQLGAAGQGMSPAAGPGKERAYGFRWAGCWPVGWLCPAVRACGVGLPPEGSLECSLSCPWGGGFGAAPSNVLVTPTPTYTSVAGLSQTRQ